MKVLLVKNKYKKKLNWKLGIDYFAKNTPITIETEEISTDWDLTFRTVANDTFTGCVVDNYYDKLRSIAPEGKYDVVCLVYGNDAPNVRVSITENTPLYKDCDVMQIVKETGNGKTFNHEMFHVLFKKLVRKGASLQDCMDSYLLNDTLDIDVDSNRTRALKMFKPYWNLLNPSLISKIMTAITPKKQYLYFNEKEVVGLNPKLVEMLDNARGISGVPFKITSGFRTSEHNKDVGGVPDSEHTTGNAVDLLVKDSVSGGKILLALVAAGFKRFGFYNDGHIHVDISEDKPTPCYWIK